MEVIPYGISVKRGSKIKLYPIGDIHAGVKHCEEHKIKELVQEIQRDTEAYWIGVGDYADYIAPTDPRWDSKVIANWVDADNIAEDQTSWLEHLLKPIRSKCMGLCFGNHEETIRLRLSCNVHKNLCESLNVPSLGYSGFVKLTTNRSGKERNTIICVTHGAGSAATKGARINRLKEFMSNFDADIYIHGHLHDNITNTSVSLGLDRNNNIKQRVRVGAMSGSWLTAYTQSVPASYAEKKMLPPNVVGCPSFIITPEEKILQVIGL